MLCDHLAVEWRAGWNLEKKFQARLARTTVSGKRMVLCRPETFMNLSGEAAGAVASFYRIPPERVLILSDDADLPLGQLRMRPGGGPGGHHGIESIRDHLGTEAFPRLRMGIGRRSGDGREIAGYVLAPFAPEEKSVVERVLERAGRQVGVWFLEGIQPAMNRFNGAVEGSGQTKETE
jgi:PTH1 family peptidyl-tRNA hydrolase